MGLTLLYTEAAFRTSCALNLRPEIRGERNMWIGGILGNDVYHLLAAFCIYSILGWFVESVYMSFCNRRLTNRGFAKGPFCPIYGIGALAGYFLLRPFAGNPVMLYLAGAFTAACCAALQCDGSEGQAGGKISGIQSQMVLTLT